MYLQPYFYHFTEDSIALAKFAAAELRNNSDLKVLDLCAGCGVVGIEFAKIHKKVKTMHFIEKQIDFGESLTQNINENIFDIETDVYYENCINVNFPNTYDVILANPPYFLKGHGRESDNNKKNTCEFISEEEYSSLLILAKNSLEEHGVFYFLGRVDQKVNKNMLESGLISIVKDLGKTKIFKFNDLA